MSSVLVISISTFPVVPAVEVTQKRDSAIANGMSRISIPSYERQAGATAKEGKDVDDTKQAGRPEVTIPQSQPTGTGKFFTFFVDDVEYHVDHEPVTGAEIMEKAGIPVSVGINVIEE